MLIAGTGFWPTHLRSSPHRSPIPADCHTISDGGSTLVSTGSLSYQHQLTREPANRNLWVLWIFLWLDLLCVCRFSLDVIIGLLEERQWRGFGLCTESLEHFFPTPVFPRTLETRTPFFPCTLYSLGVLLTVNKHTVFCRRKTWPAPMSFKKSYQITYLAYIGVYIP